MVLDSGFPASFTITIDDNPGDEDLEGPEEDKEDVEEDENFDPYDEFSEE